MGDPPIGYLQYPGYVADPHIPGAVWCWSRTFGAPYVLPPCSTTWGWEPHTAWPETPERLALWVALQLEVT